MEAPAETSRSPPPEDRPVSHRRRTRIAALVLLAIVLAPLSSSWFYLGSLPPRALGALGFGTFTLEVPILTSYSPSLVEPNATIYQEAGFGNTEPFAFRWSGSASDGSPVLFVFRGGPPFEPAEDGFTYRITGAESGGSGGPSRNMVWVLNWSIDYSAKRMAAYDGFFQRTWIQVDFSPSLQWEGTFLMPYANVAPPVPGERLPTGIVDPINASGSWSYVRALSQFELPAAPFRHTLAPISIGVGSAGVVSAVLESSFHWGPAGLDRLTMSGPGPVDVLITWYWDARFGGLYPVVSGSYHG